MQRQRECTIDGTPILNTHIDSVSPEGPCPTGMVEIDGDWCPIVEEICLRWVDQRGNIVNQPNDNDTGRCGEFKRPTRCLSQQRVHKRFCIDVNEYTGDGDKPRSWMTWYDAKNELESDGKRLCTQAEWTMACEGPEIQPYPYEDGYHRDSLACNTDNQLPRGLDVFKATNHSTKEARLLDDMLAEPMTHPLCTSPYGVKDMPGNIDEWVVNESGHPYVSGLMGGHIMGVRNRCRSITLAHGPLFSWYETGTRGCKDIIKEKEQTK